MWPTRLEAEGGGVGEGWGFEDTNRRRVQAAQELGILGNKGVSFSSDDM